MTPADIGALLARYGVHALRVRLVARLDCEVYRITPQPRSGDDLALRLYPATRSDRADIESELEWLRALANAGLNAPAPVVDRDGEWLQTWHRPSDAASRHVILLSWVHGRHLDKGLQPVHLRRAGVLCARMHNASASVVRAGRIASRRAAQGPDLGAWIDRTRPASRHLPPAAQGHIARVARQLQATIAGFARDHASFGFVHSDLHLWNLLFAGDSAGAIDFSDCGWGHYALDLAATLQYLKHPWVGNHDQRPRFERLRDALLAGYASERALPPRVDEQIDAFIALRTINTVEWVLDDWAHPAQRAWGPGFLLEAGRLFASFPVSTGLA